MKGFIKISSMCIAMSIVLLLILRGFGIAYFNMPILDRTIEKGKVLLGLDTLTKLLELDYPLIGDDVSNAYSLLGEVAFESEKQVDFYVLDKSVTLYVKYDPDTSLINSIYLHTTGDVLKIQSLGEKILPFGSLFIRKDSHVIESQNEVGRYNKKRYVSEYFYELPGTMQYALISISNETNDLFGDSDSSTPTLYSLTVSLSNEGEVNTIVYGNLKVSHPST